MQERVISGIQQVGIGVSNADEAFQWYKNLFGFDIQVFADAAEAPFMTRYTGGEVHKRYAILALNLQGGGGLEIGNTKAGPPNLPKIPSFGASPESSALKSVVKTYRNFIKKRYQKK